MLQKRGYDEYAYPYGALSQPSWTPEPPLKKYQQWAATPPPPPQAGWHSSLNPSIGAVDPFVLAAAAQPLLSAYGSQHLLNAAAGLAAPIQQTYSPPPEATFREVIFIPHAAAGRVIGKGAQQLLEFKNKSGADITVNKEQSVANQREVTLSGSRLSIALAKGLINAKLVETETNEGSIEVHVPHSKAGHVIGKGGASLKEMKEICGCGITVAAADEGSDTRTVTLTGTPSQLELGKALIQAKIEQTNEEGKFYAGRGGPLKHLFAGKPIFGLNLHTGRAPAAAAARGQGAQIVGVLGPILSVPKNDDAEKITVIEQVHNHSIGKIIGKGGQQLKAFKSTSGADLTIAREEEKEDKEKDPDALRTITITGSDVAVEIARALIKSKLLEGDGKQTSIAVTIPNSNAGQVIGKGGSGIRLIKENSGANVVIEKNEDASEADRVVTLTGTPAQVAMAEGLVKAAVLRAAHQRN